MWISPWVLTGFTGHTGRFFPLLLSGFLGDHGCTEVDDRYQQVQMADGQMETKTSFIARGYGDTDTKDKKGSNLHPHELR